MTKLCIIGAGSTEFTKRIVTDLFLMNEFKSLELSLMDIDAERRKVYEIVIMTPWDSLVVPWARTWGPRVPRLTKAGPDPRFKRRLGQCRRPSHFSKKPHFYIRKLIFLSIFIDFY